MKKTAILTAIILAFTLSCVAQEQTTPTHLKFKNGLSTDSIGSYTGDSLIIDGEGLLKFHDDITGAKTLAELATGGDVSKVGTPVDNQVGVWTGDGTLEGTTDFTYDAIMLNIGIPDASPLMRIRGSSTPGYTIYSDANVSTWVETFNNSAGTSHLNYNERGGGTYAAQAAAPTDAIVTRHQYNVHDGTSSVKAGEFEFQVDGAVVTADFDTKYTWDLKEGVAASALMVTLGVDGFEYAGDHSTDQAANDRWIPDKGYVDGVAGLYTFSNGLTESGNAVRLGGALTATNTLTTSGYTWNMQGTNASTQGSRYQQNNYSIILSAHNDGSYGFTGEVPYIAVNNESGAIVRQYAASGSSFIDLVFDGGAGTITDGINSKGLVYATDYSTNFTDRSLVDKGYVDGLPGADSSWTSIKVDTIKNSAGNTRITFGVGSWYSHTVPLPSATDTWDLGSSGNRWQDLWISQAIRQTTISYSLTDGAPTDAQIDSATGTTPSVAGSGWQRLILDSDGSALMYIIVSDGSNWQYTAMTIAL